MGSTSFDKLETMELHRLAQPYADAVYHAIYGTNCEINRLSDSKEPHVLDREFGIDTIVTLPCKAIHTIQEKFRGWDEYKIYHDFTQEYQNGDGTDGEWMHLTAQLYLYGWENEQQNGFAEWHLWSVVDYVTAMRKYGSVNRVGVRCKNGKHGGAVFYGIPMDKMPKPIASSHGR